MQVLVRDRGEGKTTALVEWLLRGKPLLVYPGWSRVIVCANRTSIPRVTNLVKTATADYDAWQYGERAYHDVRKAVWSTADYRTGSRGAGRLEVGLDDVDLFLMHYFSCVAAVTLTGELVDNLCD